MNIHIHTDNNDHLRALAEALTPDQAITMLNYLRDAQQWAGTMFTRFDVEVAVEEDERIPEDAREEIIDEAVQCRGWNRAMGDWLTEQGWEMVTTIINDCWDEYSSVPASATARLNEALAQEDN
jgi:hypothetical protein